MSSRGLGDRRGLVAARTATASAAALKAAAPTASGVALLPVPHSARRRLESCSPRHRCGPSKAAAPSGVAHAVAPPTAQCYSIVAPPLPGLVGAPNRHCLHV